jgi:hypothetical protein
MPVYGTVLQDQNTDDWSDSPSSYLRRWKRDGSAIALATASTYLTTQNDVGKTITLGKRAVNGAGTSAEVDSNGLAITGYNEFASPIEWTPTSMATLAANYVTTGGTVFTTMPMVNKMGPDELGIVSAADNGFRIPAAYNGRYMRFTANVGHNWTSSTGLQLAINRNGAADWGAGRLASGHNGAAAGSCNASTAPILVSTDDVITLQYAHSTSGTINKTWQDNWLSAELLPADYSGALVRRATGQAIGSGVWTTISYENEVYDLGGYWSVANASRLVASETGKYRLTAVTAGTVSGRNVQMRVIKNGAVFYGGPHVAGWGQTAMEVITGVVDLTAGDYLEVQFFSNGGTETLDSACTWACLERIPDARPVALLRLGADQSATADVINTNTVVHDAHSLAVTASSSFRIPQGVSRVRVSGGWLNAGSVSNVQFCIKKNSDLQYWGQPRHSTNSTANAESGCGMTAIINVAPGDLLRISTIGGIDPSGALEHTFCCIELLGDGNIPDYADDDPDFADIIFMSGFEGSSLVDEGPNGVATAIGSQSLSTTNPVIDQKCLASTASGTGVTIGDASTFDFAASEDFTIDFWARPDGTTGTFFKAFCGRYVSVGDFVLWHMASGSSPAYGLNAIVNGDGAGTTGLRSIKIGFWHHIRICRSGDTLRVFINGHIDISATGWGSKVINFGGAFGLLQNGVNNDRMVGSMDEFVAWRGVAKSPTDEGFNPPFRQRRAA